MPADSESRPPGDLNTGLETLGHLDCLRVLAAEDIGRLGVVVAGAPEIFAVNYVTDDDGVIVFRTGPGTKLTGALAGPIVFEVDHFDRGTRSGWSVVVHGRARPVGPAEFTVLQSRLTGCAVQPAPGREKAHLLRVVPSSVTGRRIRPPERAAPATPALR